MSDSASEYAPEQSHDGTSGSDSDECSQLANADKGHADIAEDPATIDKEIRKLEDTDHCSESDSDDDLETLIEDEEYMLRLTADNGVGNVNNHAALYDSNLAPPEYYRKGTQTLDLDDY